MAVDVQVSWAWCLAVAVRLVLPAETSQPRPPPWSHPVGKPRECDCPPWTLQCVHLGLDTLWLGITQKRLDCFAVVNRIRHSTEVTRWRITHHFTKAKADGEFLVRDSAMRKQTRAALEPRDA